MAAISSLSIARIERPIIMQPESIAAILAGAKTQTRRLVNEKRLRVRARHTIRPDVAFLAPGLVAVKNRVYHAGLNRNGAVFCEPIKGSSTSLGLKPDEFDFICPYADGETHLRHSPKHTGPWCIDVRPGQYLWVKETWYDDTPGETDRKRAEDGRIAGIEYRASHDCKSFEAGCPCNLDGDGKRSAWRPSIFMPRWASRILLVVTSVRLERLQAITEADALAEGAAHWSKRFPAFAVDQLLTSGELAFTSPHRSAYAVAWDEINDHRATWKSNPWVWVVNFTHVSP